jgi:hypothetical protein
MGFQLHVQGWNAEGTGVEYLGTIKVSDEEAAAVISEEEIQAVNDRLIANGHRPLFLEWADVLVSKT